LHTGPKTYIREENEYVETGNNPLDMIILPPMHYCEVTNPIIINDGEPMKD
jgi:hypothetical protein